jgi:predicted nuclease of restriction endonuclease-like (RecB) superfamily
VNSGVVLTFWEVGKRVNEEILGNERAEYGKQIVSTVSTQLQTRYGSNFALRSLRRMLQFAAQYSDAEIVSTLSTQLSWCHIIELLPIKSMEAKLYYAEEAATGNLSVHDLRHLIARKAYERRDIANLNLTSLSRVPFNTFKDPYLLDALDLRENFLEADLEKAIVRELEKFILEFGQGFSFIARQKRLIFNDTDYYADLVFFNRDLKRLVAVELKTGKFKAIYKAQMEMYLRLLNEQEKREGEGQPIGIILCTSADRALVEFLEMDKVGIAVAEFWARFPSQAEFERRIQEITAEARERLERRKHKALGEVPKQIDYFIEPKDDNDDED